MKPKQKKTSLFIITLSVFAIFLWQLYSLLSADMSTGSNDSISMASTIETPAEPAAKLRSPAQNQVATTQPTIPPALKQKRDQGEGRSSGYLTLVNHYKVVKMQHKLLQEELSIAKVRNQIAKLNQKPFSSLQNIRDDSSLPELTGTSHNETTLVYLDYQNARWSAILKDNQGYHQVSPGTLLNNNKKVISIKKSGVTLQSGIKRFNLSFNGVTPLPSVHIPLFIKKSTQPKIVPLQKNPLTYPTKLVTVLNQKAAIKTITAEQHVIHHHATPTKKQNPVLKLIMEHKPEVKTPDERSLDETVILEMPAKSYTIRLKHSENRKELIEYAKKNNMVDRTLLYSNKKSNKPRYTLVFGDYLTTRAAKFALKNLPQDSGHSIESLGSIQKEIMG